MAERPPSEPHSEEPSGDPGHSPVGGEHGVGPSAYSTPEAARIGLDRNTVEGAQVHFFSQLDGAKARHRAVAWVVLFVMFGLPLLLTLLNLLRS